MSLTKLDLVNDKVSIPLLILSIVFGMEIWILSQIYLMLQWFIRRDPKHYLLAVALATTLPTDIARVMKSITFHVHFICIHCTAGCITFTTETFCYRCIVLWRRRCYSTVASPHLCHEWARGRVSEIEWLKSGNKELLSSLFSIFVLLHLAYKYKLTYLHYVHVFSFYTIRMYVRTCC